MQPKPVWLVLVFLIALGASAQTQSNCENVTGSVLEGDMVVDAKEKCILDEAMAAKNAAICLRLSKYSRKSCVGGIALQTLDPKACNYIQEDVFEYQKCLERIPLNSQNKAQFEELYKSSLNKSDNASVASLKVTQTKLVEDERQFSPLWNEAYLLAESASRADFAFVEKNKPVVARSNSQDYSGVAVPLHAAIASCKKLQWKKNQESCYTEVSDIASGYAILKAPQGTPIARREVVYVPKLAYNSELFYYCQSTPDLLIWTACLYGRTSTVLTYSVLYLKSKIETSPEKLRIFCDYAQNKQYTEPQMMSFVAQSCHIEQENARYWQVPEYTSRPPSKWVESIISEPKQFQDAVKLAQEIYTYNTEHEYGSIRGQDAAAWKMRDAIALCSQLSPDGLRERCYQLTSNIAIGTARVKNSYVFWSIGPINVQASFLDTACQQGYASDLNIFRACLYSDVSPFLFGIQGFDRYVNSDPAHRAEFCEASRERYALLPAFNKMKDALCEKGAYSTSIKPQEKCSDEIEQAPSDWPASKQLLPEALCKLFSLDEKEQGKGISYISKFKDPVAIDSLRKYLLTFSPFNHGVGFNILNLFKRWRYDGLVGVLTEMLQKRDRYSAQSLAISELQTLDDPTAFQTLREFSESVFGGRKKELEQALKDIEKRSQYASASSFHSKKTKVPWDRLEGCENYAHSYFEINSGKIILVTFSDFWRFAPDTQKKLKEVLKNKASSGQFGFSAGIQIDGEIKDLVLGEIGIKSDQKMYVRKIDDSSPVIALDAKKMDRLEVQATFSPEPNVQTISYILKNDSSEADKQVGIGIISKEDRFASPLKSVSFSPVENPWSLETIREVVKAESRIPEASLKQFKTYSSSTQGASIYKLEAYVDMPVFNEDDEDAIPIPNQTRSVTFVKYLLEMNKSFYSLSSFYEVKSGNQFDSDSPKYFFWGKQKLPIKAIIGIGGARFTQNRFLLVNDENNFSCFWSRKEPD